LFSKFHPCFLLFTYDYTAHQLAVQLKGLKAKFIEKQNEMLRKKHGPQVVGKSDRLGSKESKREKGSGRSTRPLCRNFPN